MFGNTVDRALLNALRHILEFRGFGVLPVSQVDDYKQASLEAEFLRFLMSFDENVASGLVLNIPSSRAQLKQDLMVLGVLGLKRNGFFVEFGATDGVTLSNTWLLEERFGWRGILAEPARVWHDALSESRGGGALVDFRCVAKESGQLVEFLEAETAELSTLVDFIGADQHQRKGNKYTVETVSLNDLLLTHEAPRGFDYLSIDTEGSEAEILSSFDIAYWRPQVVTVEHNYTAARGSLTQLFLNNGYEAVFPEMSRWDAWFVRQ